jgi:hypothetical protein
MKTVSRTLRPVTASIARLGVTNLTIALAMTSSAFAHGSYDAADVQFIEGWSSAGEQAIVIHTSAPTSSRSKSCRAPNANPADCAIRL